MRRRSILCSVLAVAGLAAVPARANEEIIVGYDARSLGMGLTGTASVNNASAALHNVASLGAVKHLDFVLALGPNISRVHAPYLKLATDGAPETDKATSKWLITPLGFAAAAYSPHPRVTVGLAAMMARVGGMHYTNVPVSLVNPASAVALASGAATAPLARTPGSATAMQLVWDARLPVAINVTPWLSVGGAYRIGFTHQSVEFNAPGLLVSKSSMSGQRYTGAQAGIVLKPFNFMRVGFAYRSKLNITASGTSKQTVGSTATQSAPYRGVIDEPHQVTAGVAINLLANRLMIAADYKFWFYKDAVSKLDAVTRASTQDAMSGNIGAEFFITPNIPLRAGYVVGRSAVSDKGAFALLSSPGLQQAGTIGAGYHMEKVDLDLGFGYGAAGKTLGVPPASIPGKYALELWLLQVSANVRI